MYIYALLVSSMHDYASQICFQVTDPNLCVYLKTDSSFHFQVVICFKRKLMSAEDSESSSSTMLCSKLEFLTLF